MAELCKPRLREKIVKEIADSGPITFARFMELVLYDEEDGYYTTQGRRLENGIHSGIGWDGDYYTIPHFTPVLAHALVRQFQEVDCWLGRPRGFTVLEIGAGEGLLARDILAACAARDPDLMSRLSYVLIDRSPSMRERQAQHLSVWNQRGARVLGLSSLANCAPDSVTGVVFSNELVDALPIHRVRMENGILREIYVDWDGERLVEVLGEPSTPAIDEYVQAYGVELPEGMTTEIHVEAIRWMEHVACVLREGLVLTIDYGHTARDYYSPLHREGTLLCYHRHHVSTNPYERVGFQDITAHVNFSGLAQAGERVGLKVTGFTNLMYFVMSLGVEDLMAGLDPASEAVRALGHLLRPHGMGQTFKMLVQHKGGVYSDPPVLSGLRYRPFFADALYSCAEITKDTCRHGQ
ncbi:MAG: SAM-dependent methyltransferase [Nitrospirae bacterium]|nr:MAG: SAM-dependent methyltransferase [Nitrospirota bacterium]